MEDKKSQLAQEHFGYLRFVFLVYNHRLSHVVALIWDNASNNRAFVRLIGSIYIGFLSHQFNLASCHRQNKKAYAETFFLYPICTDAESDVIKDSYCNYHEMELNIFHVEGIHQT